MFKPGDRLLKLEGVMAVTSMSRSVLYELMKEGQFPKPIKFGHMHRKNAWVEREVLAYINNRIEMRNNEQAGA